MFNDDKELIYKIKKASITERNELFEKIYIEYYKLVCFIISKYINNKLDIEEIANDSFLKLFQNINSVKTSIKYYLTVTAKNLALNHLKKKKIAISFDDDLINSLEDNRYNSNDNYNDIIKYLESFLSKNEIIILSNHIMYDITFKELSKKLKISENSIKTTFYRAIEKIKNKGGNPNE